MLTHSTLLALAASIAAPTLALGEIVQPLYGVGATWPQGTTEFGLARGVYFTADTSFSIVAVEVLADIVDGESYDFVIFDGGADQTQSTGNVLFQTSFVPPDQDGEFWTRISLDASFIEGANYVALLKQTDDGYTQRNLTVHTGRSDAGLDDEDLGYVTYRAGRSGLTGENNNSFAPLFHLVIPEPTTVMAIEAGCLLLISRRRRL